MDRKNKDQVTMLKSKMKPESNVASGGRGFSNPCESKVQLDPPNKDEIGSEFLHVPGFSYSVSGEGAAWMGYTQPKDAKGVCNCRGTKSSKKDLSTPKVPVRAPDGGWGWVIVIASMGISLVADGISFSFGIIYIEFLEYFGESKSKTSVIGSLFMAVPLMAGPLASALVDRYGCRSMTILGGIISALGFVASSFADSIEVLCFTFGILSGLGLALCYVTAVVCVTFWFDSKRSLANGLGVCGTGVGTFVFAPLTQALLAHYKWRGTVLILAGAFLQMCICGAVMREPDNREEDTSAILREIEERERVAGRLTPGIVATTSFTVDKKSCGTCGKYNGEGEEKHGTARVGVKVRDNLTRSLGDLDDCAAVSEVQELPMSAETQNLPLPSSSSHTLNVPDQNNPRSRSASNEILTDGDGGDKSHGKETLMPPTVASKKVQSVPNIEIAMAVNQLPSDSTRAVNATQTVSSLRSTPRQALQQTSPIAQLQGLRFRRNSISYSRAFPNASRFDPRVSSCPDIYRVTSPCSTKEKKERWYNNFLQLLVDMMDLSMFLEWHFLLLSFSTFLLFTFFIVPYFYLAEHVLDLGYSESEASMLISIIGILNTVGMIILGWAGDQVWMNVTITYALCLCLCGIFTGIMPLLNKSYPSLAISCALFGLFFASNFSFTPIIIVELISLDRFTMAYGLILLTQGLGNLLGPPLAGWLYDITNTWNLSFYLAGFFIFVSGLAIALIAYSSNFIIGHRRVVKGDDYNQNNEGGTSCKLNLLEAG